MARRALVLGSQIEGLRGVENDTRRMVTMLEARGFTVDLRVAESATRTGMLAGYDQLIAATGAEDAAVVYYCGHGYYATVPTERSSWQCIAPTDLRASSSGDWRGITAWELSIKQAQLTARSQNVTVILDCCHAAQLSRSHGPAGATPRSLPHPVHSGFDQHLATLRAAYGRAFDAVDPVGNPHAVRVVACGQAETAFEYADPGGEYHGAFTDVLVDVLTEVGGAPVSWATIIGAIRARVLRRFAQQRPGIEGPVRRGVFSLEEHDDARRVAVTAGGAELELSAGLLTGVSVGDVYGIVPAGAPLHAEADALGELEVQEVFATRAIARRILGSAPLPAGATAVPIRCQAQRWAIAIDAPPFARAIVDPAIAASATLRTAQRGEVALATLRVASERVTVEDCAGPLSPPLEFPAELPAALAQLASLGVAQGIRELEGEQGVLASELAIEIGAVRESVPLRLPDHGGVLGLTDRYYLNIERVGPRTLFLHVLNISARGKIALLTDFARGGVVLDHDQPSVLLGQRRDGSIAGVGLRWPDGLPRGDVARLTELVVIATPVTTDLSGLETGEIMAARTGGNGLERALAQLCDGSFRGAGRPGARDDGFFVKRLSIVLAPGTPPGQELAQEVA